MSPRSPGDQLQAKLSAGTAHVGVIGLGYVGLPLSLTLNQAGFHVTGIDLNTDRVAALNRGQSPIDDITDQQLAEALIQGRFRATSDLDAIAEMDAISICVPTPLRKSKDPDLSYVIAAADAVASRLRPGQLIILESTTYPGTTDEILLPRFEAGALRVGKDFFLAYSPERVDPGNPTFKTENIPKVIAGATARCAELASILYGRSMGQIVVVSSTRVAEMVKILENTFRAVNIALVNELAMLCAHMHIDVWEVIRAASTKPFGFMPFYPGPGLGGHCIPIDPLYLQWKARMDGFEPKFIGLADSINSGMPGFVVRRAMELLNDRGKAMRGSKVHVLGITYKRDVADVRESPALEIMSILMERGAIVSYSDPFIPSITVGSHAFSSQALASGILESAEMALIVTDHSDFDYEHVVAKSSLVFDTRNATGGLKAKNVVRL